MALLDRALDLDTGRFGVESGGVVLYIVRIVARVDSYVDYLLDHHVWRESLERFVSLYLLFSKY